MSLNVPSMIDGNTSCLLIIEGEYGVISNKQGVNQHIVIGEVNRSFVSGDIIGYSRDGFTLILSRTPLLSSNDRSYSYDGVSSSILHNGLSLSEIKAKFPWMQVALAFGAGNLIARS